MRAVSLCVVVLGALVTRSASADIFKLTAEADAGGQTGSGVSGAQKDAAFFAQSPNVAYGAQVGAELFGLLDAWVQHHQFTDGSRITTWTQFGAGLHFQIPLGDDKQQKAGKGPFIEAGTGVWFGVGTGQQVMPPLDNAQITDKGFLVDGRIGFGTHLNSVIDLGVELPVSYGYFFKNGNGVAANDTNNHYQAVQGELLGFVRFNVKLL